MTRENAQVGQRWLWNRPGDNSYIVEILRVETGSYARNKVRIIQKIRRMDSFPIGYEYDESLTGDYWSYLEGQDKP
jgi:hypothetical protein